LNTLFHSSNTIKNAVGELKKYIKDEKTKINIIGPNQNSKLY